MKKALALLVVAGMALSMAACGAPAEAPAEAPAASAAPEAAVSAAEEAAVESDLAYIQDKGTLVVGITDFEPMDYMDENGEWIGFDADMAKAFAESLGVDVEFQEIDWDNKVLELNNTSVDCIWNGMTLTAEVTSAMDCSVAYSNNSQVVVLNKDVVADYADAESMADLTFAVEAGSAGEAAAIDAGLNVVSVQSQADALMEVAAGSSDGAVIDYLMAVAMVGDGTSYDQLAAGITLVDEEYGVGFRKGSDLVAMLNDFFKASYADGTMLKIAETYGIEGSIVEQ